ncbi:MAG: tetratricopeptide repeat protein [Acetobacteraceae bacterium]
MAEQLLPEGIETEAAESSAQSLDLVTTRALNEAEQDPEGRKVAAAFLASHKHFVDLQIAYFERERHRAHQAARMKNVSDVLRIIGQLAFVLAGLAVIAGIGAMTWTAMASKAVIVDSFEAPSALAVDGLTGTAVAGKVLDGLLAIQHATRVAAAEQEISGAWTEAVEITVPEAGISLGQVSRGLHRLFGHDIHIDGALIRANDGTLSLSVRGDGIAPASFSGTGVDTPARQAAEYIFGRAQPTLFASYLISAGRYADAVDFLAAAYSRADDASRPTLANQWGEALLALNRPADAVDRFRLALQIDPRYWRAWNNLVGVQSQTEGEQAAYQTGLAMQKAAESASLKPTRFARTNFAQLTLDPNQVVAGLLADRQVAAREAAEFDDSTWLAEQHAVMHDWPAVARYLAESPQNDPTTPFDTLGLAAVRAMEAGDDAAAVQALEGAARLWDATPVLQAYFPDFKCNLGLAYAAVGRTEEALALLRDTRFVHCRAFRADALERTGDWPGAQQAYRDAQAAAPDLSFAYYREGLALLRRHDPAAAMERLAIANRLSPRWADPLKAMGDALAAQGQWKDALERYRQALRWAPAWVELQAAEKAATEKLRQRRP